MRFISREIEKLELPLDSTVELLHPDRAILFMGVSNRYSFDVGSFCYSKRSVVQGSRKGKVRPQSERLVIPTSFDAKRLPAVRRLIRYASDQLLFAGKRPGSVSTNLRCYAFFIEYAENNGYPDVFTSTDSLNPAFFAYVEHLRYRVNTGQITQNTATMKQNNALAVAMHLSGIDNITHGVNLLRISQYARVPTEPASEESQARLLALCESLFDGLTELCLQFKPYPYALLVPSYLGIADNQLWVFPVHKWCMAPHELAVRGVDGKGYWAYDYAVGCLTSIEDLQSYFAKSQKNPKSAASRAHKNAKIIIQAANIDPYCIERKNAAKLAHNIFIILFLSRTAMNWAGVQELRWSGDYELGTERQGFRAVKYRANGKIVSFEIQTGFLPRFRKFLELRTYLLNGMDYDRLFMAAGHGVRRVVPLGEKALSPTFNTLRRLDPDVPDIKSRKWRASKSDWLLRNTDVSTAAAVLQNREATILASYASGSPITHSDEFSSFFESIQSAVLNRNEIVSDSDSTAVGICVAHGNPAYSPAAAIEPDCKKPEGCLFCNQYRIHADETDVRKLLSCQFCIMQTAYMVVSEEHFQMLFGPLIRRIESLLLEIETHEPGLIARIEQEVQAGELDPYWEGKLEMLVDLELLE
ncbi:hypothetical protein WAE56_17990 [Iodobacter sp. LRB]|uniref:hypothetical protein n=1 Tax=Iodobacter sp. LRB TaxID=3127955 RepID=UPI00307F0F6C